jgi:hypothetical protein
MLLCMRTTLNLEDDLLIQAKRLAAQLGSTLTAVIEDALRVQLLRVRDTRERPAPALTAFGEPGGGLGPGVDLDDSAALLALMEDELPLDRRR